MGMETGVCKVQQHRLEPLSGMEAVRLQMGAIC